ncbi:carboxypeptidase M32 [Cerasicoccus arenae]|uniref:Metal-dependent carboxypeptidase n=1 Tax=Cerasicoccus arenae TaxID=424488 RepID=A0A8J3DK87_9BACT|nr:carboxypeptidase M32 [Cerasicoccus arenae]MBK1859559.1 carboxypeptidase M32 [Cerasicoccus arenae]GHC03122.1 carboxypeptidase M32 [Cerasicoccus arenae]
MDTFNRLTAALKRIGLLDSVSAVLGWDEQVNLPPSSASLRAQQNAAVAEVVHHAFTRPEIGEWITELESTELSADAACIVRESRREYDRAVKLPADFVRRKTEAASEGYHAWTEARKKSDFSAFSPMLQRQITLAHEEAGYLGCSENVYDYWIDRFDPGMSAGVFASLFDELRDPLRDLSEAVLTAPRKADISIFKGFPVDAQESFLREVLTRIGFDFNYGRLDVAVHPFCGGNGWDTRLTTRFAPDNPLDSLFSAIHEAGHGMYEQGLRIGNRKSFGLPLANSVGMGVHESQSRLWENQVARSEAFWAFYEPRYRDAFPTQLKGVSSADLRLAINAVQRQPIRVDADEVTYNLHVILRFQIERALFSGELDVAGVPAAWNELSKELLGLTPESFAMGCLQDVHWSEGFFGYFPSYSLGNVLAAQLWSAANTALPKLQDEIACGNFSSLLGWLQKNVHRHGKRFGTRELVRQATGEEISPAPLINYLRERYSVLYGV